MNGTLRPKFFDLRKPAGVVNDAVQVRTADDSNHAPIPLPCQH
jgi:hypothetical protein